MKSSHEKFVLMRLRSLGGVKILGHKSHGVMASFGDDVLSSNDKVCYLSILTVETVRTK